jgi:hypothetical protein
VREEKGEEWLLKRREYEERGVGGMGKKEKRVGERMEGGERGQRTKEWKEKRSEKGEGGGGRSGQEKGMGRGKNACGETRGKLCTVVRREMGNVKQEGGGK